MTQDIKTLELAKLYESQGYYEDALKIYSFLNNQEATNELSAALKRMEKKMEDIPHCQIFLFVPDLLTKKPHH